MTNKIDLTPAQQERVAQLRRMTPREWDAICKKCGICCLIKFDMGGNQIVYIKRSCVHLDCNSRECKIYSERLTCRLGKCHKVDIDLVLAGGMVPDSCGYREYIFGPAKYPAVVDFSTVRPMDDLKIKRISPQEFFACIIPESIRWNNR